MAIHDLGLNGETVPDDVLQTSLDDQRLWSLTNKQRQVLDLLIHNKTSKEIARSLGISPHTVDQRIEFAKRKLGAQSRNELAAHYRRMSEPSDSLTYDPTALGGLAVPLNVYSSNDAEHALVLTSPNRTGTDARRAKEADYRVVPEMFEGRHGTLMRIMAIGTLAALLIFVAIGGLALFSQLSIVFER